MSDPMITALVALLDASLGAWRLDCEIQISASGDTIDLRGHGSKLLIARAPDGMPFRWVVTVDGRRRTAASVNGVLRIVRQTLTPEYQPVSLRIAPLPALSAHSPSHSTPRAEP